MHVLLLFDHVLDRCQLSSSYQENIVSFICSFLIHSYIHAYQSYLFNKLLTYRVQRYGHRPIEEDLVFGIPLPTLLIPIDKSSPLPKDSSSPPSVFSSFPLSFGSISLLLEY